MIKAACNAPNDKLREVLLMDITLIKNGKQQFTKILTPKKINFKLRVNFGSKITYPK